MKRFTQMIATSVFFLGTDLPLYAEGIAVKPLVPTGILFNNSLTENTFPEDKKSQILLGIKNGNRNYKYEDGQSNSSTAQTLFFGYEGKKENFVYGISYQNTKLEDQTDSLPRSSSYDSYRTAGYGEVTTTNTQRVKFELLTQINAQVSLGGAISYINRNYEYQETLENGYRWSSTRTASRGISANNTYYDLYIGGVYQINSTLTVGLDLSPAVSAQSSYSGDFSVSNEYVSGHGLRTGLGVGIHLDQITLGFDLTSGQKHEDSYSAPFTNFMFFAGYAINPSLVLETSYEYTKRDKAEISENVTIYDRKMSSYQIGLKKALEKVTLIAEYRKSTAQHTEEEDVVGVTSDQSSRFFLGGLLHF